MSRNCVLCGKEFISGVHVCKVGDLRNKLVESQEIGFDAVSMAMFANQPTKMKAHKRMEDHPVYAEMILRSFFELAEHAMNMSAEQMEKAWEARVRLARFAFSKAFPNDYC